jgi:hypothetical protein
MPRLRSSFDPSAIGPDTPLRLETAVKIAFPDGGMTVSGLRRERDRGNLSVERVAGKEFTTLGNIEEMRKKCRVKPKEPGSGSNPKNEIEMGDSSIGRHGSSVMEPTKSALAALKMTARALSESSPNTSPANTSPTEPAAVVLLKSSSSTC